MANSFTTNTDAPYSAAQIFTLVSDIAQYQQFLPWCSASRVLSEHADGLTAEIELGLGIIRKSFSTRNTHRHDQENSTSHIHIQLLKGPFSELEGSWRFTELGPTACNIHLALHYAFSNAALQMVMGATFDRIAQSLVQAFIERAKGIYGKIDTPSAS